MQIQTTRFGPVRIEADDILLFSEGLAGFEHYRHWVLLADADNEAVAWLQCVSDPQTALPLISPRRFAPGYQVRVSRDQLTPLELAAMDQAFVLAVLSRHQEQLTMNLKAPLIINLDRRIGRQVIVCDEQPLRAELLAPLETQWRKSA